MLPNRRHVLTVPNGRKMRGYSKRVIFKDFLSLKEKGLFSDKSCCKVYNRAFYQKLAIDLIPLKCVVQLPQHF